MQDTKTDPIRKYFCLLMLWSLSASAAAGSIFDGFIPCASENKCDNQRGGFYEDQPGTLDGSQVRSYDSADTQAERDLKHSLVPTRSAGSVPCSAGGQPLLAKICSANGPQRIR